MAARSSAASELDASRLPREVVYVYLAAPIATQPIANPDFFREPAARILVEVAGNYLPAVAILLGLHYAYRLAIPRLAPRIQHSLGRLALHIAVCALVAALMSGLVHPLHEIVVGEHDIDPLAYLQRNVGVTCLVIAPAVLLADQRRRVRAAELRLAAQERAALQARVQALQSRTQPHFLFNTLNTIMGLVRDDAELAERTIERLGGVLRYAMASARHPTVELRDEIDAAVEYLEIQRARFGPRLRYAIEIDPVVAKARVPPLMLQPLVENAVLHAIAPRAAGGRARVIAVLRDGQVVVRVEDDGPGPGASAHRGSGTSLADLEHRLELLHGEAASLRTWANDAGGYTVELALPHVEAAE